MESIARLAAILFVQVIGILSFMGLAQRYAAEFFPFLVFAFLFFLGEAGQRSTYDICLSGWWPSRLS